MTSYTFSAGSIYNFNPSQDILQFGSTIAAADVKVLPVGSDIILSTASGAALLKGVSQASITSSNIVFLDGSMLLLGDNTTETANDGNGQSLVGGALNDLIIGMGGSDTIIGGSGHDVIYGGSSTTDSSDTADQIDGGTGDDVVYGNGGNDTITGSAGQDTLYGGYGNDTIAYNSIATTLIYGGTGTDTITAGTGDDTLYGGSSVNDSSDSADSIDGGGGNDLIYANGGNDTVTGSLGQDTVYGGAGNDTVTYSGFATRLIYGGADTDTITTGTGDDVIYGGSSVNDSSDSADSIDGGGGSDRIYANGGNDTVSGNAGYDTVYGGAGNDTLSYNAATEGVVLYGNAGSDTLKGGNGNDTLYGGDASTDTADSADSITAGAGSDIVYGNGGDDSITGSGTALAASTIYGGDGADTVNWSQVLGYGGLLYGGDSNDTLIGAAYSNTLDGGAGNDSITAGANTASDSITGGAGSDIIVFASGTLSAADTVWGGDASSDSDSDILAFSANDIELTSSILSHISGIEEIRFYSDADDNSVVLTSAFVDSAQYDTVSITQARTNIGSFELNVNTASVTMGTVRATGGYGDDFFTNGGENSYFNAGEGNDTFSTSVNNLSSHDTVIGGNGTDYLSFSDAGTLSSAVFTNISGVDIIALANGSNTLTLTNAIIASSDSGNSLTIAGGSGADTINASTVTSGHTISVAGGQGNDAITGGADDDTLSGGAGSDTLSGGAGNDIFAIGALADIHTIAETINGGDGTDSLRFDITGSANISAASFTSVENIAFHTNGNQITATHSQWALFDSITGGSGGGATNTMVLVADSVVSAVRELDFTDKLNGIDTIQAAGSVEVDPDIYGEIITVNSNLTVISSSGGGSTIIGNDSVSATTITVDASNLNVGHGNVYKGSADFILTANKGIVTADELQGQLTVTTAENTTDDSAINITPGAGGLLLTADIANDAVRVNADNITTGIVSIVGSSQSNLTIANLRVDVDATLLSGTLTIEDENNNAPNTFTITTGSGITTITRNASDDIITVDALALTKTAASDLILSGTADFTVTGLNANLDASGVINALTVTADNAAQTLIGGESDDTISAGSGGDTILAGAGADAITLAGDGNPDVDYIVWSTSSEGAAAGANSNYDVITNFNSTGDYIAFTGDIFSALASGGSINATAPNINTNAYDKSTSDTAAFSTAVTDVALTTSGFTAVIDAIGTVTVNADDVALFIVVGTSKSGIYYFTDDGNGNNSVSAGELTLLGIVNTVIDTANVYANNDHFA